ncbi:MAG: ATP-dependent DNA helicase RecG, partial [Oscillospiraceae bacterium]
MAALDTDVRYLKGIGEKRAETLAKLGIRTLRDLVGYFPRTYEDRSQSVPIALAPPDTPCCIHALVATEPTLTRIRRGMELVKFRIVDDSGSADVTYFNQSYLRNNIRRGGSYVFYGKVSRDGAHRAMTNPIFEAEDGPHTLTERIVPVYQLTAGVSQKQLLSAVRQGLDACAGRLPNALPDAVAEQAGLCQNRFAYENIHFPKDFESLALAENRLVFEELFVLACALTRMKNARVTKCGPKIPSNGIEEFYAALPFSPTGAQKRAVDDCLRDMASGNAMNRLVQGDVGSGKTLVAAACIWAAHRAGLQCAFMAPTEILASQHVDTFTELLSPFGIRVVKLTGALTAKQKREALSQIASGEADLAVGTHALLSEGVEFQNLGLVVTDEQHRFGVAQRAALVSKGERPHTLVMSATPIPRTLALIIYGDLDVSVIDEMPPGRQTVDTFAVGEDMRARILKFIRKQVEAGHQVFIVCPAVEESEERPMDLKSAKEYAAELQAGVFSDLRVGCVHG